MGRWIQLDTSYKSYVNPEFLYCEACGKMIPKDAWIVRKEDNESSFCNKDCEELYDYMVARRKKRGSK